MLFSCPSLTIITESFVVTVSTYFFLFALSDQFSHSSLCPPSSYCIYTYIFGYFSQLLVHLLRCLIHRHDWFVIQLETQCFKFASVTTIFLVLLIGFLVFFLPSFFVALLYGCYFRNFNKSITCFQSKWIFPVSTLKRRSLENEELPDTFNRLSSFHKASSLLFLTLFLKM